MNFPTSLVAAACVGAASGLHTATWGMYKDAMYEGFCPRKYARSPFIGIAAAILLQALMRFDLGSAPGLLILFGLSYVLERALVEFHKSFIRVEDQSKYFIPMAFAVGGRVVHHPAARAGAGAAYAAAVLGVVLLVASVGRSAPVAHPLGTLLLLGTAGGWISAFGGAWKDAPKEGFETLKFFRSPAIALVYALALAALSDNWLVIAFGSLGFTIATIETHKMFDRSHTRGKFTGKPVLYPETLAFRRRLVPVFVAIWVLVLGTLATALSAPQRGVLGALEIAGLS